MTKSGTWNRCPCRSWRIEARFWGSINSSRWLVRFCQPDTIQSNLDFTWSAKVGTAIVAPCVRWHPQGFASWPSPKLLLVLQPCNQLRSWTIKLLQAELSWMTCNCNEFFGQVLMICIHKIAGHFRAIRCYTCLLRVSSIHSDLVTIAIVMTCDDWFSYFVSKNPQSLSLPGRTCERCELHNASIIDHTILWTAEDGGSPTSPTIETYCDHMRPICLTISSLTCGCRFLQSIQNCCNML